MKKPLLVLTCVLSFAGCFFGGANDTTGPSTNEKPDTLAHAVKLITPGLYVGDYTWIDSNKAGLESEFILDATGDFRLFWISNNEAVYDQHGSWYQKDSNFYFNKTSEVWAQNGIFDGWTKVEDDTNSIRNVTDTSFIRREYTPLRQKPYWITYKLKPILKIADGSYSVTKIYPKDSTTTQNVTFKYEFDKQALHFTIKEDTLGITFERIATWSQFGSFLAVESIVQRSYVDSTKALSTTWDTLNATQMELTRLKDVADTALKMWTPASLYDSAGWDPYSRGK